MDWLQIITWNLTRAGGFTAYILLTLSVTIGLALSLKLQSPNRWPRMINSEMHNFLSLLGTIFLVIHILAAWIDPYMKFAWYEILLPLTSHYRPTWIALGIVALYLGVAIGISTLLRPKIGYTWWRRLHILTFGVYILATIHGIGSGTDSQTGLGLSIYAASILLVGALLFRRIILLWLPKRGTETHKQPTKLEAAPRPVR